MRVANHTTFLMAVIIHRKEHKSCACLNWHETQFAICILLARPNPEDMERVIIILILPEPSIYSESIYKSIFTFYFLE